jgi:hypothetical protein
VRQIETMKLNPPPTPEPSGEWNGTVGEGTMATGKILFQTFTGASESPADKAFADMLEIIKGYIQRPAPPPAGP